MDPNQRITGMPFTRNMPSRDGQQRLPSREKDIMRKTNTSIGSSQQNFFRTSQYKERDCFNEYDMSTSQLQQQGMTGTEDLILNSLNIAVDETTFTTTMKSDILQLQEDINKLDFDGKIRNSNPSELLKKNHIYGMMKYLSKHSNQNIKKQLESKINLGMTMSVNDLVKFMGAKDEADALKKLYKMTSILDLMLTKVTEYQAISYLKYDQIHESLKKAFNSTMSSRFLNAESSLQTNRFQLSLAITDRLMEIYGFTTKLIEKNGPIQQSDNVLANKLKTLTSIEEMCNNLKNGEHYGLPAEIVIKLIEVIDGYSKSKLKDKTNVEANKRPITTTTSSTTNASNSQIESLMQRIKDLEKQLNDKKDLQKKTQDQELFDKIQDLTTMVDKLKRENENVSIKYKQLEIKNSQTEQKLKELESKCQSYKDELNKMSKAGNNGGAGAIENGNTKDHNTDYYLNMLKDIENNHKDRISILEKENLKLNSEVINLRVQNEKLKGDTDELASKIAELYKENDKLSQARKKGDDSFEVALREQFDNMKAAFEKKIMNLQNDIMNIKKEKAYELVDLKAQLNREKDNRELLLRKLQIYTRT